MIGSRVSHGRLTAADCIGHAGSKHMRRHRCRTSCACKQTDDEDVKATSIEEHRLRTVCALRSGPHGVVLQTSVRTASLTAH